MKKKLSLTLALTCFLLQAPACLTPETKEDRELQRYSQLESTIAGVQAGLEKLVETGLPAAGAGSAFGPPGTLVGLAGAVAGAIAAGVAAYTGARRPGAKKKEGKDESASS